MSYKMNEALAGFKKVFTELSQTLQKPHTIIVVILVWIWPWADLSSLFAELQGEPGVMGPAGREGPPGKDVSTPFWAEMNLLLPDKWKF